MLLTEVKIMKHARWLLLEAAVAATSPARAPPAAVAVNQVATPGGTVPAESDSDSSSSSPFYVNSHFTPTMIIILVILSSAFFFMALFAVYVRRCTSEEGVSQRGNSQHMSRRDEFDMGSGVDPLLVESYPIVSYAVAKKKGCYECPVCLIEFEGADELKQLPKCKHVFHPGCIGLWLESHTTCPLCRRSLVNSDRWSLSFRWGGSSRGNSLSTRRNGEESSRSRRREGTASSRFGRAGSSTGWFGRNRDGSHTGMSQHETSISISDANASGEPESQALPTSSPMPSQRGIPASHRLSEVAPRVAAGQAAGDLSESVLSNLASQGMQASSFFCGLMPREIEECSAGSDVMPRVHQYSDVAAGGLHAGAESTELAANTSSELAKNVLSRKPRQAAAVQGRRKMSRSNSTGHSLRRRAALQATGCMPFSLHRSRSVGVDGVDDKEAMVDAACATSEHDPLSGSSCSSQIPQEPCHVSTSASTRP